MLAWIETHLLPCLTTSGSQLRRPPRRLLTSSNCTLLSDPEADTLSQTVVMSDASIFSRSDVSAETKAFVTTLIKVCLKISVHHTVVVEAVIREPFSS